MSCCSTEEPGTLIIYVQAGAPSLLPPNPPYPAQYYYYLLSAPLISTPPQFQQAALSNYLPYTGPSATRMLRLYGAPCFQVRIDASIVGAGSYLYSYNYVSVGLSTVDTIVDTLTYVNVTSSALPTGTIAFNYGSVQDSSNSYCTTSASLTAIVPPGTYYACSIAYADAESGKVVCTFSVEAEPIACLALDSDCNAAALETNAWGPICYNCAVPP